MLEGSVPEGNPGQSNGCEKLFRAVSFEQSALPAVGFAIGLLREAPELFVPVQDGRENFGQTAAAAWKQVLPVKPVWKKGWYLFQIHFPVRATGSWKTGKSGVTK